MIGGASLTNGDFAANIAMGCQRADPAAKNKVKAGSART
jgi:hypothetical protein